MVNGEAKEATDEIPEVQRVPKASKKEIQPYLSQIPIDSLSVLADTVTTSTFTQPYTQPNDPPRSLPNPVTEYVDDVGCPCNR